METSSKEAALTKAERWIAGVSGLLSVAAAALLFYCPPMTKQFPPQCAAPTCLTEVPASPMPLVVGLMVAGILLVLFALNGRRLSSLKVAGVEAEMPGAAEAAKRNLEKTAPQPEDEGEGEPPPGTTPTSRPSETITVRGIEYEIYALDDVPIRVIKDALAGIEALPAGTLSRIDFIARRSGRGNHPWLMKFRDQDETWKISYGGQGKEDATVKALT